MTDLATSNGGDIIERVIAAGDLARLSPEERTRYYGAVCQSLGLNPLTKPFEYLSLSGKLVLYATRGATDQLRRIHHISTSVASRETVGDVYVVTARATDRSGRSDESIGAVAIGGLKGDALCNALMKAETKAKRRATLAIVGLSFLDETETETIPGAQRVEESPVYALTEKGRRMAEQQVWREPEPERVDEEMAERRRQAILMNPPATAQEAGADELSGPRWGSSELGRRVSAAVDVLTSLPEGDPRRRFVLPANAATDEEVRQWLASKKRLLEAQRAQR